MSITTADKASRFAALHKGPATFVMPNAFDAGTDGAGQRCYFELGHLVS